jgi:hypothetical protein
MRLTPLTTGSFVRLRPMRAAHVALVVTVARLLVALVVPMVGILVALVVSVVRVLVALVVPAMMVVAIVGALLPTIVDVARARTVAMIRLTPNLGVARTKVALRVVVVPCVNVPAWLYEAIAIAGRNPMAAHPYEAYAGVPPIAFHPDRAYTRGLGTHDHVSRTRGRRLHDDNPWSWLLDDDPPTFALYDNVVVVVAYADLDS